jgi:hypothetical protein
MKPETYKAKYLQLLKKPNLTKSDVKEFNDAVSHYKQRYPNWQDNYSI